MRDVTAIWKQNTIPVAWRMENKSVFVRNMTYGGAERVFAGNYWKLPRKSFNDFINRALSNFGKVYIIQPYRERETCAPACRNARGHECQCSCMGQYHGAAHSHGWFDVSETFSVRWGDLHWACRLLTAAK